MMEIKLSDAQNALLARCGTELSAAHRALAGAGYYVMHDLPIDTLDDATFGEFLLKLVQKVALPIPQNRQGDLIVRIEDEGSDYKNPTVRGHKTNAALAFHTDRTDLIFLMYIRQAKQGGGLKLADSRKLAATLQEKNPALFDELCGFFPNDAKREQGGTQDWFMAPIFFADNGKWHCRYIRRFIEESQRLADAPRLTTAQIAALDWFDAELARPENHFVLAISPGDLLVIDNHSCLHARDAYEDATDVRRLAIRAWAAHAASPNLPPSFAGLYHTIEAGTIRGGFTHLYSEFRIGAPVH